MIDAGKKIEKIKSEEEDYYADDDIYNFNSWGADLSFRELIDRYDDNELLKPELQRNYVWDKAEASRFIDSILLKLPVPSIFLAKQDDEKLLIIDGYQRLMTVYDFVKGIFSQDGRVFKLSNSNKINDRWKGNAFSELSDTEQRRIKNTTIHAIIFVQTHPSNDNTGMYQVFERINTSGRTLYPQEIRNCVYQGDMNDLLIELNKNNIWRSLFGTSEPDTRMRDMEFILRYFAMSEMKFDLIKTRSISLKKELNLFMGKNRKLTSENKETLYKNFITIIEKISETFGKNAFHNISKTTPDKLVNKFNPTIFDSFMLAFEKCKILKDDINTHRLNLLKNNDYQEVLKIQTTDISNIIKRINLVKEYLFQD